MFNLKCFQMKNISTFLIGTASTMGMAESIVTKPEVVDSVQNIPVDSTEAIISVIGGAISTIIIALLKRWWKKIDEKRKKELHTL